MRRPPRRVGAVSAVIAITAVTGTVHHDRAAAAAPSQLTPHQIMSPGASSPMAPERVSGHRSVMRDGDYVVEYHGMPRYWPGWGDGINEGSAYSYVYATRADTWGADGMQYALADSYSGLVGNGFDVPHAMLHQPYWLGVGPPPFWSSWLNSRPYIGYPQMHLHYPPQRIVVVPSYPTQQGTPAAPGATPAPGTVTQPGAAQQFQGPGVAAQSSTSPQYGSSWSTQQYPPQAATGAGQAPFANCHAARAAGQAPVRQGTPGYSPHLDADNDGIGCE